MQLDDVTTTKGDLHARSRFPHLHRPAMPHLPNIPAAIRRSAMQTGTIEGSTSISLLRESVGEIVGTFTFLLFGFGSICTSSVGGVPLGLAPIAFIWGIGVALGIGISSALSDSHLNPAVTLAMVLYRGMSPKRAAVYWASQVFGSFIAALLLGIVYLPQINAIDLEMTRKAFEAGLPPPFEPLPFQLGWPGLPNSRRTHVGMMLFYEALAASILVGLVLRLDPGNGKPQHLGAAVCSLIIVFAPLSGAGFNPARDLGPRIAASFLTGRAAPGLGGFGGTAWWPYTLGPLLGAAAGGGLHELGSRLERTVAQAKTDAKGKSDEHDAHFARMDDPAENAAA